MTDRLRVLVLVPDGLHGRGGIERLMLYLTREMPGAAPGLDLVIHPTRLTRLAGLRHVSTLAALAWFIARCLLSRPDIVHVNVAPRGSTWRKAVFARIARLLGLPVVLHLHGSGYDAFYARQTHRGRAAIRAMFQAADRVIVLGPHWARFVLGTLGCSRSRVAVIANGAPDTATRATPRADPCRIAFAGRIGHRKGVDCLIEALGLLRDLPGWSVQLGGDGPTAAYRDRAIQLGIADRVTFPGWLDEPALDRLLGTAQIFVLPSRAENQPVAILEAMARGLPVVSTRIAAIPDLVSEGETGLLVPPDDPRALAEALDRLLRDPDLRRRMGRAGRARFEARFALAASARQLALLYHDLVPGRPAPLSLRRDAPAGRPRLARR